MSYRTRLPRRLYRILALTVAVCAVTAVSLAATSGTVDGFSITFNLLPSADITTGLSPSSLINLPPYTASYNGVGALSNGLTWGQTNPFNYSGTLNGSAFDAVYNGSAVYTYATPQTSFSMLWGSVDTDNQLSFYDGNGNLIGTILGSDLLTAITAASPGASYVYVGANSKNTVDITVSVPSGFSSVRVSGAHDLTFEYSNIVASSAGSTPVATPAPNTATLTLLAIALLGLTRALWRKAGQRA